MEAISLYQGDSSLPMTVRPFIADPAAVISDDWVCKTRLMDVDGTEYVGVTTITTKTDDGLHFVVTLSPTDTGAVDVVGEFTRCKWIIQLTNEVLEPIYNREQHVDINVKKQGIPNA